MSNIQERIRARLKDEAGWGLSIKEKVLDNMFIGQDLKKAANEDWLKSAGTEERRAKLAQGNAQRTSQPNVLPQVEAAPNMLPPPYTPPSGGGVVQHVGRSGGDQSVQEAKGTPSGGPPPGMQQSQVETTQWNRGTRMFGIPSTDTGYWDTTTVTHTSPDVALIDSAASALAVQGLKAKGTIPGLGPVMPSRDEALKYTDMAVGLQKSVGKMAPSVFNQAKYKAVIIEENQKQQAQLRADDIRDDLVGLNASGDQLRQGVQAAVANDNEALTDVYAKVTGDRRAAKAAADSREARLFEKTMELRGAQITNTNINSDIGRLKLAELYRDTVNVIDGPTFGPLEEKDLSQRLTDAIGKDGQLDPSAKGSWSMLQGSSIQTFGHVPVYVDPNKSDGILKRASKSISGIWAAEGQSPSIFYLHEGRLTGAMKRVITAASSKEMSDDDLELLASAGGAYGVYYDDDGEPVVPFRTNERGAKEWVLYTQDKNDPNYEWAYRAYRNASENLLAAESKFGQVFGPSELNPAQLPVGATPANAEAEAAQVESQRPMEERVREAGQNLGAGVHGAIGAQRGQLGDVSRKAGYNAEEDARRLQKLKQGGRTALGAAATAGRAANKAGSVGRAGAAGFLQGLGGEKP